MALGQGSLPDPSLSSGLTGHGRDLCTKNGCAKFTGRCCEDAVNTGQRPEHSQGPFVLCSHG